MEMIMKTFVAVLALLAVSLSAVQVGATPFSATNSGPAVGSLVGTSAIGPQELPPVNGPGL
jgi:hypothetical protein